MGLDYTYLLYFERKDVWDVLKGLSEMVEPDDDSPTFIQFPDHQLSIPLKTWSWNNREMHHDDPELDFQIAMYFSGEDEKILEYNRAMGNEDTDRSPPDAADENKVLIGVIYLTVFLNNPDYSSDEHILFKFTAAGTTMSILFADSTSIQNGFIELLKRNNGVSGALDRESGGGRLFWYRGESYAMDIYDAYMKPDEIEEMLRTLNLRDGNV